jgi:steroid 5-alpha reductase family enzyme
MSPLAQTLLATLAVVLTTLFVLWLLSVAKRDASIIDPFWGTGFILVTWTAFAMNPSASAFVLWSGEYDSVMWLPYGPPRSMLLALLTTIWGTRLSLFLLCRNWGHGEDRRYQAMRVQHGQRFWWVSLISVYLLQGVILWFVALPIQVALVTASDASLSWLDAIGGALWAIGEFFETVGDWQLARFKADPANAGRVMDRGLWRLTRHPNYFGDFCVWWGVFLIASSSGAWWTVLSPLAMSVLLLKVSGVTLLEKTITERRPEYAAYQARTNAFFPGPPRVVEEIK